MKTNVVCAILLLGGMMALLLSRAAAATTIVATKDVTLGQYNSVPENTNFSSGSGNLELLDYSGAKLSALIGGFDVSQYSSITSAKLNFYYMNKASSVSGGSLGARAVTSDWDESTATLVGDFNLRPSDGLVQSGYSTVGQNVDYHPSESYDWGPNGPQNAWVEIDVSTIVQNWVNRSVGSGDMGILLIGGVWHGLITVGSTETPGDFTPYLSVEGSVVPEPSGLTLAAAVLLLPYMRTKWKRSN